VRRDVYNKGAIQVTTSSVSTARPIDAPQNVDDFGSIWTFCSRNEPRQWICFDFNALGDPDA